MSTYVGCARVPSDIPGIAVRLREQVPPGASCTVFIDDLGGVFYIAGTWNGHEELRVCRLSGEWTASELAHELLVVARRRRIV